MYEVGLRWLHWYNIYAKFCENLFIGSKVERGINTDSLEISCAYLFFPLRQENRLKMK
jgi:hypothetical protein